MTKDELIGVFRTCENNCKLSYVALVLLAHDDMPDVFDAWYRELEIPRPYDDLEPLLRDREVLQMACEQLYDAVHRAAIKELFETTRVCFREHGELHRLHAQPWYQFWRILRNCFSHDFLFHFNDYDRKCLPVSWGGVTIDKDFEGQPLTHGLMSREKLWELLHEVKDFVERNVA